MLDSLKFETTCSGGIATGLGCGTCPKCRRESENGQRKIFYEAGEAPVVDPESGDFSFKVELGLAVEDFLDLGFTERSEGMSWYIKQRFKSYQDIGKNLALVHYPDIDKVSTFTIDLSKDDLACESNFDYNKIGLITCKTKEQLVDLLNRIGT